MKRKVEGNINKGDKVFYAIYGDTCSSMQYIQRQLKRGVAWLSFLKPYIANRDYKENEIFEEVSDDN